MCGVEPQRDSLRRAPKDVPRSPPASSWLPASHRPHQPLVRQGPKEDEMREQRNDDPERAAFLRWGNGTAKQGAVTQSDDVCAYSMWNKPGTRWATEQLAQNPGRTPRRFRSTEGSMEDFPQQFGVETILWAHAAKKSGMWYRGFQEEA